MSMRWSVVAAELFVLAFPEGTVRRQRLGLEEVEVGLREVAGVEDAPGVRREREQAHYRVA